MKIAVIGAGIAGITTALQLQDSHTVTLFEKSRGVGRLATRYKESYQFDFGAPYFRAKTAEFQNFIQDFIVKNTLEEWHPRIATNEANGLVSKKSDFPFYISTPKMTSLGRTLASQLDQPILFKTRVQQIVKVGEQWQLIDEQGVDLGVFDWVISAMPLEQAQELLPNIFVHSDTIQACKTDACFSLMLGIPHTAISPTLQKILDTYDVVEFDNTAIKKLVVENAKQKHLSKQNVSLTVYADNTWSEQQIDNSVEKIQETLVSQVLSYLDIQDKKEVYIDMHRWRFANVVKSANEIIGDKKSCLLDYENKLLAVGDWCCFGSVEGAWISAMAGVKSIRDVKK